MLALGKCGHSNARAAAHLHDPTGRTLTRSNRFCQTKMVGHMAFLFEFCPLTPIVIFVSGMHVYVHIYCRAGGSKISFHSILIVVNFLYLTGLFLATYYAVKVPDGEPIFAILPTNSIATVYKSNSSNSSRSSL